MSTSTARRWDPFAAIASLIALVMLILYLVLIGQQRGQVAGWFLTGLAVAIVLGGYGTARTVPHRRTALAVSAAILLLSGIAGLLSVGLPIVVAGALMLVAALRDRRQVGVR